MNMRFGMNKVTSKDGTLIAFDRFGRGPAVILVSGALSSRAMDRPQRLAHLLAKRFAVYTYDRRGRNESGDTAPYAVEREVEDIEALIDRAGGSAYLVGGSSGAVLALEAAAKLPTKVRKLVMYEPPFLLDDSRPPVAGEYLAHLAQLLAFGRRGDAVELFLTQAVGLPVEALFPIRNGPTWPAMEAMAHTLAYDAAVMGANMAGRPLDAGAWSGVEVPTLVIVGGASPEWMHSGAQAIASALPNAQSRTLEGQTHDVAPEALAPLLEDFFAPPEGAMAGQRSMPERRRRALTWSLVGAGGLLVLALSGGLSMMWGGGGGRMGMHHRHTGMGRHMHGRRMSWSECRPSRSG